MILLKYICTALSSTSTSIGRSVTNNPIKLYPKIEYQTFLTIILSFPVTLLIKVIDEQPVIGEQGLHFTIDLRIAVCPRWR